jgi:hypothetical protein
VTINTLAIDPIQGTVQLPTDFSTPAIAQGCQASSRTSRLSARDVAACLPVPLNRSQATRSGKIGRRSTLQVS